jgi:lipopolysaccharide/colanic/teichoic acid biosynthesis glycosyltransferase
MTKRALDLILGTLLSLLVLPTVVCLAVGAAVSLGAWPFFVQRRVGRDGREFRIIKIRTLPPTAPAYADKYTIAKVPTPRFCAMLRRLHLDELPQLFLVPFGSMSLVGPRPEMRVLHDRFDPEFAAARTTVRPGCTGLWQISDGIDALISEVPQYDLVYIANAGVRLDLWVFWQTVKTMVRRGGLTTLDEIPAWAAPLRVVDVTEPIDLRTAQYQPGEDIAVEF